MIDRTVEYQSMLHDLRPAIGGAKYHDVDMVNSLPNVAKQLHKLGMTSEANVRVLNQLYDDGSEIEDVEEERLPGQGARLTAAQRASGLRRVHGVGA